MPRPPKSPIRKKPGPPKTVPDRVIRGPGGAPIGNQNALGGRGGDGYPTEYDDDYHPKVALKLALMGSTNPEIANVFGVALSTLENWLYVKRYVKLVEAIVHSREIDDSEVAYSLRRAAKGYKHKETKIFYDSKRGEVIKVRTTKQYPPDVSAAKMILYNSRGDKFKPHPESEDPNAGRGNVTLVIGGVAVAVSTIEKTSKTDGDGQHTQEEEEKE
jgi:hypothetical protein